MVFNLTYGTHWIVPLGVSAFIRPMPLPDKPSMALLFLSELSDSN